MTSEYIIEVNETDFEYEVLAYSQNTPVVVDFWATWCRPCKTLSPLLETLAYEGMGSFRLAKVDVDANPNLALQFGVRSVPTIKAFSGAEVVGEFVGNQPEDRVRAFIANITPPSKDGLALEKANSLLLNHDWSEAEESFLELIEQYPDRPEILLGLAKSELGQGNPFDSLLILRNLGSSLGISDRDDQIKHLHLAMEQIRAETVAAEEEAARNVKLWSYLGFLGGLLLVLVLY
ncbi:MAG: Putative thioredoxin [Pelotomaculum thermopropionicum]|uniref:Putative thioredoxin n=1 Tax=Pelotomaculum thermopropionicum TaxID=110500 RepID=A0A101HS62_9FIRM|nr:MAG: Putative thioredoxin [Pelotomaculum thermopropionicum]